MDSRRYFPASADRRQGAFFNGAPLCAPAGLQVSHPPGPPDLHGRGIDPPSAVGHNPPYGASINYFLGSLPAGEVEIEIADAEGRTIRKLKGTKQAGLNRLWWDLKYEPLEAPRLRTSPLEHPEIGLNAEGWRAFPMGPESESPAPLVPPGAYTVKLKVGQADSARQLTVLKDPNSQGSEEGIRASTKVVLSLYDQLKAMTSMINEIESLRKQITDLRPRIAEKSKDLSTEAEKIDAKLVEVESAFFDPHITSRADSFYYPPQLYSKVESLVGDIAASDFPPTQAQIDVYQMFTEQLEAQKAKLAAILSADLAGFNSRLKAADIPYIEAKGP